MISYARKTHTNKPLPAQVEDNRFEQIRRQEAEGTGGPTRTAPFAAHGRRSRTIESFEFRHTPRARRIHSLRPAVAGQGLKRI
jgi:hypothetical protein